jgi:hypothetical protein
MDGSVAPRPTDCARAIFVADLLKLGGGKIERLIHGNALPFAPTAFADASYGV